MGRAIFVWQGCSDNLLYIYFSQFRIILSCIIVNSATRKIGYFIFKKIMMYFLSSESRE